MPVFYLSKAFKALRRQTGKSIIRIRHQIQHLLDARFVEFQRPVPMSDQLVQGFGVFVGLHGAGQTDHVVYFGLLTGEIEV